MTAQAKYLSVGKADVARISGFLLAGGAGLWWLRDSRINRAIK